MSDNSASSRAKSSISMLSRGSEQRQGRFRSSFHLSHISSRASPLGNNDLPAVAADYPTFGCNFLQQARESTPIATGLRWIKRGEFMRHDDTYVALKATGCHPKCCDYFRAMAWQRAEFISECTRAKAALFSAARDSI